MQNPGRDIEGVVRLLTSAATVNKYFTANAGFRHPLCSVTPGPLSRESVLGIYQWYRVMSPKVDLKVESHPKHYPLDVVQQFHIRHSPFQPAPPELTGVPNSLLGKWVLYIALQEDFYHPDDLVSLVIPPLAPVVQFVMHAAGSAQVLGFWRARSGEGTSPNTDRGHDSEECEPGKAE
ncbi:hypothetical protein BD779DRAFT_1545686 [Infundibulicybe gibba]|nr:hypothetical protein BD779DRAFT_1545686 [Infundibulicybe gibba]